MQFRAKGWQYGGAWRDPPTASDAGKIVLDISFPVLKFRNGKKLFPQID